MSPGICSKARTWEQFPSRPADTRYSHRFLNTGGVSFDPLVEKVAGSSSASREESIVRPFYSHSLCSQGIIGSSCLNCMFCSRTAEQKHTIHVYIPLEQTLGLVWPMGPHLKRASSFNVFRLFCLSCDCFICVKSSYEPVLFLLVRTFFSFKTNCFIFRTGWCVSCFQFVVVCFCFRSCHKTLYEMV